MRQRIEILLRNIKGQYLVGNNARHGSLVFPGGGIESDENLTEASKRELHEESGKNAKNIVVLKRNYVHSPIIDSSTSFSVGILAGGPISGSLGADKDILQNMRFEYPNKIKSLIEEDKKKSPLFMDIAQGREDMLDAAEELFKNKPLSKAASVKPYGFDLWIVGEVDTITSYMQKQAAIDILSKNAEDFANDGKTTATVGQFLVNDLLPDEIKDYKRTIDKKALSKILQKIAEKYPSSYVKIEHDLRTLGDVESLKSFRHLRFEDLKAPIEVGKYLREAKTEFDRMVSSGKDIDASMAEAYGSTKEKMNQDTLIAGARNRNALTEMVISGSRGQPAQVTDTIVAPLMVADYKNRPIPIIIDRSYAQGLTPAQYFAQSYGTRKGMISTKLATPKSGYFSKMLGWSMNNVLVSQDDCKTDNGISYTVSDPAALGRFLAHGIDRYEKNTQLTSDILSDLKIRNISNVVVRSPITCESENGICKLCMGKLKSGQMAQIGYGAGIVSAAAQGEPLSQGMLSEKHTGGAIKKRIGGFPLIESLVQIPKDFPNKAALSREVGTVEDIAKTPWGGYRIKVNDSDYYSNRDMNPIVNLGDRVEKGTQLTEGVVNPQEFTGLRGAGEGRRLLSSSLKKAFEEMGASTDRIHFEVAARSFINFGKVNDMSEVGQYLPGEVAYLDDLNKQVKFKDVTKMQTTNSATYVPGVYLAKNYLHYSVGTELMPSMIEDLYANGIKTIDVTKEKLPYTPIMVRAQDTASYNPDWMAQLYSQGIKKNIMEAAQTGAKSSYRGKNFVHPFARGITFGQGSFY